MTRSPVRPLGLAALAAVLAALAACVPFEAPGRPAADLAADAETTTVVSVTDGDTIRTDAGRVRIVGIDTPEQGECGYDEATAALEELLSPGDVVTLTLSEGQNSEDRYGRLLRHVTTVDGADVALRMLEAGFAVARYDSRDGYPQHPFEDEYHAAQVATTTADGSPVPVMCR